MIDSASKHLGDWLQSIPKVHTSAFYKWIKDKFNVFNDAYILLLKQVEQSSTLNRTITYVSVELGRLFGSLYGGCDFLNTLSEIKNVKAKKNTTKN